ncbi:hypothetical protein [Streptomyces sp. LUP47B]|uniref:hypothetical protein n=1 Tax=Streptomyces sp. LUP47B TaxID=1890286 RepID=UPI000851C938|nr:hypothetical protein [Streptomyces sp. LUP47B]
MADRRDQRNGTAVGRLVWTSLLLLAVFTGLLATACRWLRSTGTPGRRHLHRAAFSARTGRHAVSKS